ncbi:mitogen-activated protein kinase kinase 2-like [Salvia splendens]|uniref:mitogen-activated protein kinase kinase 2-like n=1 Tax=Salvia splendens TaxID=180675 RepID=UPI001C261D7C|nr:mitogen-activated protein kinase kinase 2-like [Salvia splendens]
MEQQREDDAAAAKDGKQAMKMKKGHLAPALKLSLPPPDEASLSKFVTGSGAMKGGDLLVNKDGVQLVSENEFQASALIQPSDNQLSLADFDVVQVIGKGNGGIVHLVQHKWTAQFFALKVIQTNVEESTRMHIIRELQINESATQSPYIVVFYRSFYENGAIYIILEYMDGGSLADFMKKVNMIPEPYLAAICKQVLKGLWYLHNKKHIIHRDMKPSNLLINHRGEVKITDFGVSAMLNSTSSVADTFTGTYMYMSPERIRAGPYGFKSDIWSLGLVLLECATGKFPFSPPQPGGWAFYDLMNAIVDQPAPYASSDVFSTEFCSFISSCVQKDPKDRLSANELMAHPFITMYDELGVDLALYLTSAGPPQEEVRI